MKKTLLLLFILLYSLHSVFAAHFIVGFVNDSYGGVSANGNTVVVWNPANGISDNVTDIIGPTGNSGTNNVFMVDCELLQTPCALNDQISAMVIDAGDGNTSETKHVTVSGAGFDQMPHNRINTPPAVSLMSPIDEYNSSGYTEFECNYSDLDGNANEVQLWGNWTGTWHLNETIDVSGSGSSGTVSFNKTLTQANYLWTCFAEDNLSIGMFADENKTFVVDTTPPTISSIFVNESTSCSTQTIRVNCTATDTPLDIASVIIQTIAPNASITNITASILTGDTYYIDTILQTAGDWRFNCIAEDTAGNENNLTSALHENLPLADLVITQNDLFFNATPTVETQSINVTAHITNNGCNVTNNVVVGFYNGDKDLGGTNIDNTTISIGANATLNTSVFWAAEIGLSNIFVYVDLNENVAEENESNNEANKTAYITAWQEIYGNATLDKKISNNPLSNLSQWLNDSNFAGNIFITDSESTIDWYNLQAISRNESGQFAQNDFTEIDTLLTMTNLNDSINTTFTQNGNPIETRTFNLFSYEIANVSIINSTNNLNFKTGILWDTSDDLGNQEYDTSDKEDIVFITEVNKTKAGKYEISDYEIRIPARLREYFTTDTQDVYYYYELN